jgi:hypothetical protein
VLKVWLDHKAQKVIPEMLGHKDQLVSQELKVLMELRALQGQLVLLGLLARKVTREIRELLALRVLKVLLD